MRLRLFLLLVVPAAALLVLAAVLVTDRHASYQQANQATAIATLAGVVADLDDALGSESISSAQLFLGDSSVHRRDMVIESDRRLVDQRIYELEEAMTADPALNAGVSSAVEVVKETLRYRGDIDLGKITPLQIADRYAYIRGELIDSLGRRAAATPTKDGTLALTALVELIESRSVHVDERLAVQLGILYEQWAVGQHSSVIHAIAVQEEMVGERSHLAHQSDELRVPSELHEMRETLAIVEEVPDITQDEWLAASDEWLAILDVSVDRHYSQLVDLFESKESEAATERLATGLTVGGAMILALFVTVQVSYRLVRRISIITKQAKRLAAGSRPAQTAHEVKGRDEIGQLASTFDEVNDRLATAMQFRDLESAVLEGIAHDEPLEEILERSARLLGTDADGTPLFHFTSTRPHRRAKPITRSDLNATPLWLVSTDGTNVSPPDDSHSRAALGLAALAQSRADATAQLAQQATFDGLTGLLNRRAILQRADGTYCPPEPGLRTGFVFIDLDDFKRVNDNFGHGVGDSVLVAQSLRIRVISEGLGGWAGRLGGDEFLVVIPNVSSEQELQEIAGRFVGSLSEPLEARGNTIACTASAGAVIARPGVSVDELRHEADHALYEAKNKGRGSAIVASEALRMRVRDSEELQLAFRSALGAGEIVPYFQPVWSHDGSVLAGLEALARWRRPGQGTVSPAVFLPVAEELGLLRELDELLFREVCTQVADWRSAGLTVPPVHVNASSVRIEDPRLVESTMEILDRCECPPSQIILEVTESGLMADLSSSSNSLQGLRDNGIRIAADDFGSGYSSLSYLKGLPVDILKIDRQFIDRIDESPTSQAIVVAVHTLAAALGMQVIGEGVERQEEMDYLTSIGCHQVQGYLFGRPAPPAETQVLLGRVTRGVPANGKKAAAEPVPEQQAPSPQPAGILKPDVAQSLEAVSNLMSLDVRSISPAMTSILVRHAEMVASEVKGMEAT